MFSRKSPSHPAPKSDHQDDNAPDAEVPPDAPLPREVAAEQPVQEAEAPLPAAKPNPNLRLPGWRPPLP
jgi:hypothetical protein